MYTLERAEQSVSQDKSNSMQVLSQFPPLYNSYSLCKDVWNHYGIKRAGRLVKIQVMLESALEFNFFPHLKIHIKIMWRYELLFVICVFLKCASGCPVSVLVRVVCYGSWEALKKKKQKWRKQSVYPKPLQNCYLWTAFYQCMGKLGHLRILY